MVDEDFLGIYVVLDCVYGVMLLLVVYLFVDLDVDIFIMGVFLNGLNINDGVGFIYLEVLSVFLKEKGVDVGLVFDGDGDCLIVIDEKGEIVDGD